MRITFVITNAFGSGGTIRTTLTMAAALADRHDVEVISVHRHREEPMLPVDPSTATRMRAPLLMTAGLSAQAPTEKRARRR